MADFQSTLICRTIHFYKTNNIYGILYINQNFKNTYPTRKYNIPLI